MGSLWDRQTLWRMRQLSWREQCFCLTVARRVDVVEHEVIRSRLNIGAVSLAAKPSFQAANNFKLRQAKEA
jgi:hypothetical protein